MVSVAAGIRYSVAAKQNGGMWQNILSFITRNVSEKRAALRPTELRLVELKLPAFIAGHYSP